MRIRFRQLEKERAGVADRLKEAHDKDLLFSQVQGTQVCTIGCRTSQIKSGCRTSQGTCAQE
jgi:hypothetical protein